MGGGGHKKLCILINKSHNMTEQVRDDKYLKKECDYMHKIHHKSVHINPERNGQNPFINHVHIIHFT